MILTAFVSDREVTRCDDEALGRLMRVRLERDLMYKGLRIERFQDVLPEDCIEAERCDFTDGYIVHAEVDAALAVPADS